MLSIQQILSKKHVASEDIPALDQSFSFSIMGARSYVETIYPDRFSTLRPKEKRFVVTRFLSKHVFKSVSEFISDYDGDSVDRFYNLRLAAHSPKARHRFVNNWVGEHQKPASAQITIDFTSVVRKAKRRLKHPGFAEVDRKEIKEMVDATLISIHGYAVAMKVDIDKMVSILYDNGTFSLSGFYVKSIFNKPPLLGKPKDKWSGMRQTQNKERSWPTRWEAGV